MHTLTRLLTGAALLSGALIGGTAAAGDVCCSITAVDARAVW